MVSKKKEIVELSEMTKVEAWSFPRCFGMHCVASKVNIHMKYDI